ADIAEPRAGSVAEDEGEKRCVFISYTPKAFENMRRIVRKYADDGCDVMVLPITKYNIAPDMTGITAADDDEADDFYRETDSVKVTRDAAILSTHPDIIFTKFQYEEFNMVTGVDKMFYSKALKPITDRLVYVPAFEVETVPEDDERTRKLMPMYVCTRMATVCDEIVLHSRQMKDCYKECLTAFSGEAYSDIWEKKITVFEKGSNSDGS
ncbi:MAG: hypothetical protein K6F73_05500, partial [Lachnospiraceae bacterium]|nr:hypothetical protein [Lachnospiraceae bacterium]